MERSPRIGSLKSIICSLDAVAEKVDLKRIKIILCGGLAMIAYGMPERSTLDIDAEIDADFDVIRKLKEDLQLPAELSADISRWSMIDIPPGYRDRVVLYSEVPTKHIEVFLLAPTDLIISKLRVFRDKDIEDAVYLVNKIGITKEEVLEAAEKAVNASPPSTEVLRFKKMVDHFVKLAFSE